MQPNAGTAAIYVRISQDRAGAGLAVERQEADCRRLATELGLQVMTEGVYVDNDVSATTGKRRPQFERLLRDAQAGFCDTILAWHTDRLYRLPADLERLVKVIENNNVTVKTVTSGELDLSTPHGALAAHMFAGVSRYEVQQKVLRQKRESLSRAVSGEPRSGGVRPFGYDQTGKEIIESEACWVREASQRVIDGQSLMSIIRDMNAAGVKTTRGGTWNYPSLTALLTRWRNAAVRQHEGKPLDVEAQWPALVTREQLEAVRSILADPSRRTTPGRARKHLLSFILRCGRCGGPMRAGQTSSRGKSYPLYQCHGVDGCRLAISYDVAERHVLDYVHARLMFPDPGLLGFTKRGREELVNLRAERGELATVSDEIKSRRLNPRDKAQLLETIEDQREALDIRIDEAMQRASLAHVISEHLAVFEGKRASLKRGVDARNAFNSMALERRREVVKSLCRVTVQPAQPGVQYRGDKSMDRIEIVSLDPNTGEPLRVQERWS